MFCLGLEHVIARLSMSGGMPAMSAVASRSATSCSRDPENPAFVPAMVPTINLCLPSVVRQALAACRAGHAIVGITFAGTRLVDTELNEELRPPPVIRV